MLALARVLVEVPPLAVQQQGLRIAKATRNFLLVVGFVSTDGRLDNADLGDFIASNVQDALSRTPGVGDYQLFGAQYAMRIWLDPDKLASRSMTPADVITAIRAQNAQVSAGQLGGTPSLPGTTQAVTCGATLRPRSSEAASRRSSMRELVQEPMKTQSTLVPIRGWPGSRPM